MGDLRLIPGFGRSPGEGKGYTLQFSGLEISVDCIFHGVTKSPTRLKDFHFQSCEEPGKTFAHFTVDCLSFSWPDAGVIHVFFRCMYLLLVSSALYLAFHSFNSVFFLS